jgi:predicted DNA-binding protein (MmcQ/YjbR family)
MTAAKLLASFPGIVRDAPYLSRRHWVRVSLDGFPDDELRDLVDTSFRLVCAGLPKAQRPLAAAPRGQTFSG